MSRKFAVVVGVALAAVVAPVLLYACSALCVAAAIAVLTTGNRDA